MPILTDFTKALGQMMDPKSLGIVLRALVATVLLLLLVGVVALILILVLIPGSVALPFIGTIGIGTLASLAAVPVIFLASGFLMFPVAALLMGLFLDEISNAVEARHYPHLVPIEPMPLQQALTDALRFALLFLVANGFALVIYLLIAPLAPFIFWIVNGYLIGREYFNQVARRRLEPSAATDLRRHFRWRVWGAGILMAVPLSIPIVNLIVPILGIATFTHQVERLRQTQSDPEAY